MQTVHGTVVDIAGKGVLLRGESGAGKSDLALRLIDRGACLVADDQVCLSYRRKGVFAACPERLRGYLEVRGVGILPMPITGGTYVKLIVSLAHAQTVPRLPDNGFETLLDKKIHCLTLNAFEQSTPIKIELALKSLSHIGGGGFCE